MVQAEDGTKNLVLRNHAAGRHVLQQGGLEEVAFAPGDGVLAAIQQESGAVGYALLDEAFNSCLTLRGYDRPHLHVALQAIAHADGVCRFRDLRRKAFARVAHRYCDGDGQTALSGAAECAVAGDPGRRLHVGIGQDQHRVLGSSLALHSFAVCGRLGVNVFRHLR